MKRPALIALVTAFCLAVLAAVVGVVGAAPAQAATTQQTWLTFFGWWDNTPPSGEIAHPVIHDQAGGTGTFADPITLASATQEMPVGTKVYVPRVKKYFIMEDDCQECEEDWTTHGPNGGPGLRHIDLWVGGQHGSPFDSINCEDALTRTNDDGSVLLEPVIANPDANQVFDPTPLFNEDTGECYGGAQPHITVGQYRNGANGQCIDDPNNSSTVGTALKTAPCNGSAQQQFRFEGAFLIINTRCAGMSGSNIVLQTCTGGPAQQWSINPNGTISDIQTGQKCIGTSGTNVVARSCSGSASQWTFTESGTPANDFSMSVNPSSATVARGSSATATVGTAVVSGSAQAVSLSASGAPAGVSVSFSPASVSAGASSTMTVSTTSSASAGISRITVTGTSASATHSATYDLTITTPGGTTRYEAENGTISQGILETVHPGFSGAGYVNCDNVTGSFNQVTVTTTSAGTATVAIRYANGTSTSRPTSIAVNGTVVTTVSFAPTANWDTWATRTITVTLNAGSNTLRVTGTSSNGPPNLDFYDVTS